MAYPTLTIEVAFSTDPLATPTYVNITDYVLEIEIRRGRNYELDRFEAGTAVLLLDNKDRRFDPTNASGPYYPIYPVRKVRISAVYSAVTYYLFTGYIQEWPPGWDEAHNDEMRVPATDGFLFLNNTTYTGSRSPEFSGDATNSFLTAIGWPAGDRSIGNGQTFIAAATLTRQNALAWLQSIAAAEQGALFIDGQGRVVYQGRHYRLTNAAATTSNGTFGYGASEIPYVDIQPVYDDAQIKNDVHVQAAGYTEQIATDATSQGDYFPRTLALIGLIIGDGSGSGGSEPNAEANGLAQWLLYNLKDPQLRIASLTVSGHSDDTVWPHALGRQISERITVKWDPPSGAEISRELMIESVAHRIKQDSWLTTWQFSLANAAGWWILNTSALDSTTRLAH